MNIVNGRLLLLAIGGLITVLSCVRDPKSVDAEKQELMAEVAADSMVTNKVWILQRFELDGKSYSLAPNTNAFFLLENGMFSGSAGCNQIKASARIVDGRFSLGEIERMKGLCPGMMTQEEHILSILNSATSYEAAPMTLTVIGDKGRLYYSTQRKKTQ